MATWEEFVKAAPELAAFGTARLIGKVSYLATVRSNGAPRVHPITLHIGDGRLFVYMEPTSPKARDLQRDSRYAVHGSVEDLNGGQGEFAIRGQAHVVEDTKLRNRLFEVAEAEGFHPEGRYVVFELSIEGAMATVYEGDQPQRKRWDMAVGSSPQQQGA